MTDMFGGSDSLLPRGGRWWGLLMSVMAIGDTTVGNAQSRPTQSLAIREVVRVRGAEHDLSVVGLVGRTDDGTIWVTQPQDGNAVGFTAAGARVRVVGKRGEGPGEFRVPGWLFPLRGGLGVADPDRWRVTRFGERIGDVTTFPVTRPPPLVPASSMVISVASDRVFYLSGHRTEWIDGPQAGQPIIATISTADYAGTRSSKVVGFRFQACDRGSRTGTTMIALSIPFCQRTLYPIAPRGAFLALVTSEEAPNATTVVEIHVHQANGAKVSTSRHNLGASPVPKASMDSAVARVRSREGRPGLAEITRAILRPGVIPRVWPPATEALVTDEGDVWVLTRSGPRGDAGLMFVRSDGTQVGRVPMAHDVRLGWAGGRELLLIETQSDGLSDVVLYRIAPD
jgi:hypothetical protein